MFTNIYGRVACREKQLIKGSDKFAAMHPNNRILWQLLKII